MPHSAAPAAAPFALRYRRLYRSRSAAVPTYDRGIVVRIGYLVPEFPSQTHAFFWREIQALRELGHEVHVLSTSPPTEGASNHAFTAEAGLQTTYLASSPPAVLSRFAAGLRHGSPRRALSYVAKCETTGTRDRLRLTGLAAVGVSLAGLARRAELDHIHVHSCADAAHLAAVAHLVGGVSFSLTLHGDLPVYGRNHEAKMAQARFVATVTHPLRDQVCELMGWPADRVPVIQMGVDTHRFTSRNRALRPRPDGPLRVLTVARLNPTKGHLIALEAIRRVIDAGIDVQWVVAGEGEARPEIEAAIARLRLGTDVELVGTVSEDRVVELLNEADVFMLPSYGLGEAAPVSVMEAMACGLAVVCSSIGGTPAMVEDGSTGILVPQRDVDSLCRALSELAGDAQLRASLGEAARNHAQHAFDYRSNARKLTQMIEASGR